jgi:PKD repeat protein
LRVSGFGDSDEVSKTISVTNGREPAPISNFTYNESNGVISFINTSQFATAYSWDFGDGSVKSSEANPKHTYLFNKKYSTVLTASGPGGLNVKIVEVEVKNAPLIEPKKIYISKIILTGLGYYPSVAEPHSVSIRRSDPTAIVSIFKCSEVYNFFKVDERYEFSDKMPFLINYPERVHAIRLADAELYFNDVLSSTVYFEGQQGLITYLRKKGFPAKTTISDATNITYKAIFEVEFKYEY